MKIFTTGGTIDKVYFDANSAFQVGEPEIARLLHHANVNFDFEVESLMRKDSLEITDEDRALIRERVGADPARRVLITHGTDTMVDTARELADIADKTIVLTGAMQPARITSSDAAFNIGCAVTACNLLGPGVYLAMNGRIFHPDNARKNLAAQRFEAIDDAIDPPP